MEYGYYIIVLALSRYRTITLSHMPLLQEKFDRFEYSRGTLTESRLTVFLLPKIHCSKITYDVSNAIFFMTRHKPGNNTKMNVVTYARGGGGC